MEKAHREKIIRNIDKLIQFTNYDELMQHCLQRRIMFDVMQEWIEMVPDKRNRHIRLFEKITHRGPKAYSIFESILREYFPKAFEILEHVSYGREISIRNRSSEPIDYPSKRAASVEGIGHSLLACITAPTNNCRGIDTVLEEYTKPLKSNLKLHVKHSTRFHESDTKVSTYRMQSKNRGVLFLVNIIDFEKSSRQRRGAEIDRNNMISLFRDMGFQIFYYENLRKEEFVKLVDKLAVSKHLRHTDCLVFALLSHGEKDLSRFYVEFSDHKKLDIEDIITRFSNINCEVLMGKPKIFLFPFCRGELRDLGTIQQKIETDAIGDDKIMAEITVKRSTFSDIKICYATIPGYVTFRDTIDGSWYIETMCNVWSEHAHDTHLDDLLKIVGNTIAQRQSDDKLQTCANEDRGFFKQLYFNPGFYG